MVNKTNFEPINIDDFIHDPINQEKVQSYPPELVGRFNSFIVTAFDDSMTVEMQIRTMIKWVKENIDVTMSALDNMEAFKQDSMAFQNHVKDTLVTLINQFTDTFDDNLQFEMQEILKQWDEDGYLQSLINEYTNERIDTLELNKISKGQVGLSDLRQEVKESMTGGSLPIVGTEAVGRINVKPLAISADLTTFINRNKNLFNPSEAKINKIWNNNAETEMIAFLQDSVGYTASGIIATLGITDIHTNKTISIKFMDGEFKVSDSRYNVIGHIQIPSGVKYLVFNTQNTNINGLMLNFGKTELNFEVGENTLDQLISVEAEAISGLIPTNRLDMVMSDNIYNKETRIAGYYVNISSGALVEHPTYEVSEYINVFGKDKVSFELNLGVGQAINYAFYDKLNTYFYGGKIDYSDTTEFETVSIPVGSYTMRFSAPPNMMANANVQFGDTISNDTSYYCYPKGMVLKQTGVESKNIVWMGDSLSNLKELPHRVADLTDDTITDVSIAGATLTRHMNPNYDGTSVMRMLEDAVAKDYTRLDTALQNQVDAGRQIERGLANAEAFKKINWSAVTDLVIFAGTNDYGGSDTPIEQFETDVNSIVELVNTLNNNIKIYFVTPPYRDGYDIPKFTHTLIEYSDVIQKVGHSYGYPVKYMLHEGVVNQFNATKYLNADLLHQNDAGDVLWAEILAKFIESN